MGGFDHPEASVVRIGKLIKTTDCDISCGDGSFWIGYGLNTLLALRGEIMY
jgi:hypothetical protein